MSKTREKFLWQWLSKARLFFKGHLHMGRIENSVSGGMPDVEGHLAQDNCGQFWIELKTAARPKTKNGKVRTKVRPKQVEWHRRRWILGAGNYFLLQVGSGSTACRYLLPGKYGKELKAGMTEKELMIASRLCSTPAVAIKYAAFRRFFDA